MLSSCASLYLFQDHKGISNAAPADAPLRPIPIRAITMAQSSSETVVTALPESRIHDHIGNLRFSISPTAFFQVCSLSATICPTMFDLLDNNFKLICRLTL